MTAAGMDVREEHEVLAGFITPKPFREVIMPAHKTTSQKGEKRSWALMITYQGYHGKLLKWRVYASFISKERAENAADC